MNLLYIRKYIHMCQIIILYFYFAEVYNYLQKEWLIPYRESFVSCWVDEHLNYRNYTTNRVESEHNLLKAELKGKCAFHRILECVNSVVVGQHTEIKGHLEQTRIYGHGNTNLPLFRNLQGVVSQKALQIMTEEINRLRDKLKGDRSRCGCKVLTSCGLPCACQLALHIKDG
jgi:hypothetical protein